MDDERKNNLKKKSLKMTFKIIIRKILGIPHSLTGLYVKISVKVLKRIRRNKSEKSDEIEEESLQENLEE